MPGRGTTRKQTEQRQRQREKSGYGGQVEPERTAIEQPAVGRLHDRHCRALHTGQRKSNALIGGDDEAQPGQKEAAQQNQTGSQQQPATASGAGFLNCHVCPGRRHWAAVRNQTMESEQRDASLSIVLCVGLILLNNHVVAQFVLELLDYDLNRLLG